MEEKIKEIKKSIKQTKGCIKTYEKETRWTKITNNNNKTLQEIVSSSRSKEICSVELTEGLTPVFTKRPERLMFCVTPRKPL